MKHFFLSINYFLKKNESFLNQYGNIFLLTLLLFFLTRITEALGVLIYRNFPFNYIQFSLLGFLHDIIQVGTIFFVLIIPAYFFKKKESLLMTTMKSISFLLVFIQIFLILYFLQAYVPLDKVVFSYSADEIKKIIQTSSDFNLFYLIPLAVVLISIWILLRFRPVKINKLGRIIIYFCLLLSFILNQKTLIRSSSFSNPIKYYITVNKPYYFLKSLENGKINFDTQKIIEFQQANSDRKYVDIKYPLLYSREKNESNLYPFFNFKDEKPNIVLIIMESLGSRYSGLHAELGSFTPFLDSLASISLYWPHALCTSERTINVLPSVLGSLPYSKDGFTFVSDSCLHLSMISLLIKNGYTSSFFYGGGIQFDKMYNFLRDQGIQTINGHDFYKSADGTVFWGINDQELYKEGISTISKIEAAPRVDIFLTLSTHGPWDYPDIPKFEAKADQLFKKYNSPKEMVDNAMIRSELSSIIFADSTLKELFLQYKKRKDFENTIFIITGDHEFAQTVPKNRFDLYQVPLIIYSPLLKGPKEFKPIVSHLDITPSVLNLLDKKYSLTRPDYEHWLGKDLDTCHIFRSDRKLGFLCLDREINDYLYNDVLLLNNDIFKVNPDLSITLMDMPEEKQQMVKRLDYFRCMNRYTTLNKIVSEEIYCKSFK